MNAQRRKELARIKATIDGLRAELETVRDEEQVAYDALPQSLQDGERGEKMQDAITAMESAIDSISSAVDEIELAEA